MSNRDSLKTLHTALIDAEHGYEEAIKDADAPEMKSLFETMRALHQEAHDDVHAILVGMGERPDESGSFLSLVHETVISVRSKLTGLERSSLSAFASGEERIVAAYDAAIQDNRESPTVVDKLDQRKTQLVEKIAGMKRQAA